jgi:hypothetical protein
MKCEAFRESVQNSFDAAISVTVSGELLNHAEVCVSCKSYYESSLALHQALYRIPRVSPSADLVRSLNRINQPESIRVKLSWGPELRLAVEMLIPVALPYIAQAFSLDHIQHALEVLMVSLGLALFGVAVLKPWFLRGSDYRTAPEKS